MAHADEGLGRYRGDTDMVEQDRCPAALSAAAEHSEDGIEYPIGLLARVRGEEAQDEVAILLQERVLAPVPPIRLGSPEMLAAIERNDQARLRAKEVHLERAGRVKCDG